MNKQLIWPLHCAVGPIKPIEKKPVPVEMPKADHLDIVFFFGRAEFPVKVKFPLPGEQE